MPRAVIGLGAVICVAGGYLLGVVVSADDRETTTAEVVSFDSRTSELCLRGEELSESAEEASDLEAEIEGEGSEAELCGYWMQPQSATVPASGDRFEFSLHNTDDPPDGVRTMANVLIYGAVVD